MISTLISQNNMLKKKYKMKESWKVILPEKIPQPPSSDF